MRIISLRQLKLLRNFPVPPEVLEAGKRELLIIMADMPMAKGKFRWTAFVFKRAMAAAVTVVVIGMSGGGVYAAQDSLPGDRLYTVKLAVEDVGESLAFSPEQRFEIQARHAERRLEETQKLMARTGIDSAQRQVQVKKTLRAYAIHLSSMDRLAESMAKQPSKKGQALKAVMAAENVLDRQAELVAKNRDSEPAVIESMRDPIDHAIRIEDNVFASMKRGTSDKRGKDDDEERKLEQRHLEHADWHRSLRLTPSTKPLEIGTGT